jgi:hypothetical protein
MYLLQASTLTKLFLPEWHMKCLENPKILADPTPFRVHIPRAVGAIELWHNRPVLAASLIAQPGKKKSREVTDDEVTPLVQWLTNPQNSETDQWGVVEIPVENDLADTIMAMIYEGKTDEREKFMQSMKAKMGKAVAQARELADQRVMRSCDKIYKVVKQTVEHMKKTNSGVYSPSYSEALAMTVMKDTISARRRPDEAAANMMRQAMSQMEQPA